MSRIHSNNKTLTKNQKLEIGESLFTSGFTDSSISDAEKEYNTSLYYDDIFEIALVYTIETKKPYTDTISVPTDALCDYIRTQTKNHGYKNPEKWEELFYLASLDALETQKFESIDPIQSVFSALKEKEIFSKTYIEHITTKIKAESLSDDSNLAVRIFNAVVNEHFDEELTGNLDRWLPYYFPQTIFDAFDMNYISPEDIKTPINKALSSIIPKGEKDHTGRHDIYDFTYIEKVNRIANALDFIENLSVGKKKVRGRIKEDHTYYQIYNNAFSHVRENPENYFNIDTAIKTISQNNDKHENDAVEKSLNVLELIKDCNGTKPKKYIQTILKNYIDTEHPVWSDIRDRKVSDDLKKRMSSLYKNYSGNLNALKTDAQIFLEQQKAQKDLEAARQKELIEQERQKAAKQREWEELNILPTKTPDAGFEIGQRILFEVHNKHGRKITGNIINITGNESSVPNSYGQKVRASLPSNSGISNNMTCVGTVKNTGEEDQGLRVYDVKEYIPTPNTENQG